MVNACLFVHYLLQYSAFFFMAQHLDFEFFQSNLVGIDHTIQIYNSRPLLVCLGEFDFDTFLGQFVLSFGHFRFLKNQMQKKSEISTSFTSNLRQSKGPIQDRRGAFLVHQRHISCVAMGVPTSSKEGRLLPR